MANPIEIVCDACGSDEHLRGAPTDDGLIELTCDACDVTWTRNPKPHCVRCDGDDMEVVPHVIVEKSRGTQMSIQGIHTEYLCRACDAEQLAQKRDVHLPQRLPGSQ